MPKKVLLIVNSHAGTRKSRAGLFDIVDTLCNNDCAVTVHMTLDRGDATRFVEQYAPLHDQIVCCGGDGTLNEVINGLMRCEKRLPIGYIPAGSTNDFASSLKLPKKLRDATENAINGYPHGHDIGCFNGRYFSYIASLGAFTKVSYSTPQRLKNALGHAAYILEGAKDIGEITPFSLKMESEDRTVEGDFLLGSVSNSTSVAGLFRLNPLDVRLDDGQFEVMLIRNPKNPSLAIPQILRGLARQEYDPEHIVFFHAARLKVTSEQSLSWTLDGERGGTHTQVEIQNLHNAIEIIRR